MSTVVFPGDRISIPSTSNVKLGPGLAVAEPRSGSKDGELIVTLPGYLGEMSSAKGKAKASNQMDIDQGDKSSSKQVASWVESNSIRYLPAVHDPVICQITNRGTESYQVTLFNSYTTATISGFAFEGATKRNKPNLKVGTLLYAQVISAHRYLEVELTCVDPTTGKSNGYGELKTEASHAAGDETKQKITEASAMLWKVSCGLSRRYVYNSREKLADIFGLIIISFYSYSLLKPSHSLLSRLATHFPFEVAVGVNGYIWVRAGSPRHVIAVGKVLERADRIAGHTSSSGDSPSALQITKNRGLLSIEEITSIVEPYK